MSPRIKLPAHIDRRHGTVIDATGQVVCIGTFDRGASIANALNKAGLTRAERAVVKAAMRWYANTPDYGGSLGSAVETLNRLEAERAKAKKGGKR
jgi:hypothetical protein